MKVEAERVARIIPARAGFTSAGIFKYDSGGDHPRSRGVYCGVLGQDPDLRGSSPLARGLRVSGPRRFSPFRIIPARAGFTPARTSRAPRTPDHPRSRGVYPVRGTDDGQDARIIPARAGFTTDMP